MVKSYRDRAAANYTVFKSCASYFVNDSPIVRRPKRRKKKRLYNYWNSPWGVMLKDENIRDPASSEGIDFRRRSRVLFPVFCKLVTLAEEFILFSCATKDSYGRACAPIELKILSSLRILGWGWVMDDVTELTGMSNEITRVSFHKFNKAFVAKHYQEYVHIPVGDELSKTTRIYDSMGLAGCIGSMDGVHVIWDKCSTALSNYCRGKEKQDSGMVGFRHVRSRSGVGAITKQSCALISISRT
jgi:Plant transposon protein